MPGRRIGVESGVDSAATTSTAPSSASETARLRRNRSRSTRAGARFQSSRVARVSLGPWTRTRSFTLTPVSSALGGSTLSPWDTHQPVTLPPGPSTPGLLQTLGMLTRPHGFMERCRRRYGDVFTIDVAPYGRMVFIAEPELIRQAFTGDTSLNHVAGGRHPVVPAVAALRGEPRGGRRAHLPRDCAPPRGSWRRRRAVAARAELVRRRRRAQRRGAARRADDSADRRPRDHGHRARLG